MRFDRQGVAESVGGHVTELRIVVGGSGHAREGERGRLDEGVKGQERLQGEEEEAREKKIPTTVLVMNDHR